MNEKKTISQGGAIRKANRAVIKHSRTFRALLFLLTIYAGIMAYFILEIQPDSSKVPFESPATWLRDLIWIIGWRYNLDYLIIGGFLCIVILETGIYDVILRKSRDVEKITDHLSIYISPAVNFGFAFLYMIAIDVGVTYFADIKFNGTWESAEILFLGFTPRELYHNFFFWYIPLVIICGIVNQVFFRTRSWVKILKAFCICMGVYSLDLGFLDPIVCQLLWGDWRIFGTWAMGGADAIWAEGWITHYTLFATFWFAGPWVIGKMQEDVRNLTQMYGQETQKTKRMEKKWKKE